MTFAHIILFLLISKIIKHVHICAKAYSTQSSISTDIELEGESITPTNDHSRESTAGQSCQRSSQSDLLTFNEMLMITVIKLLKLYFTPVSTLALNLVHCVNINDSLHLFVYGEVKCYTYWQTLIFAILLPSLVLFPISFELCVRLLKKQQLSSVHFTLAL